VTCDVFRVTCYLLRVTCYVFGVGVWSLEFGVCNLEFGVWSLEFGVWSLEFGVSPRGKVDASQVPAARSLLCRHAPRRLGAVLGQLLQSPEREGGQPRGVQHSQPAVVLGGRLLGLSKQVVMRDIIQRYCSMQEILLLEGPGPWKDGSAGKGCGKARERGEGEGEGEGEEEGDGEGKREGERVAHPAPTGSTGTLCSTSTAASSVGNPCRDGGRGRKREREREGEGGSPGAKGLHRHAVLHQHRGLECGEPLEGPQRAHHVAIGVPQAPPPRVQAHHGALAPQALRVPRAEEHLQAPGRKGGAE